MKTRYLFSLLLAMTLVISCQNQKDAKEIQSAEVKKTESFEYVSEQFADIKILRYQIPGFDQLSLQQKKYVYFLTQAGLSGRDIMYDQNYRYNLSIRRALENIYKNYEGDRNSDAWKSFEIYLKRIWFSNGIHHHYASTKFDPGFTEDYLNELMNATGTELRAEALDVIFNDQDRKKVNLNDETGLIKGSAINFYGPDLTVEEVSAYYDGIKVSANQPIEKGLNSKLLRENGEIVEKIWKSGGMYGASIDKIIFWLEKAKEVAENEAQAKGLELLIKYYQTGDLKTWDEYNIVWAKATDGDIDYINGFIEVYNDPKGYKGSYESVVQIKDFEMSQKMAALAKEAQWFEDNSTLDPSHKKKNVVGVSYKTVNVAGEAGDASPATPIGINLPNNNWIREQHGSKSVSLGNIIHAYNNAGSSGRLKEFAYDEDEIKFEEEYGQLADKLHTALHEVIGHASGQLNPGVGTPKETLKNYSSTLEEARADLVGLYYLPDTKLVEIGVSPDAAGIGKAAYDGYIRNGLMTQLIRLNLGDDIEEAHMRNRQLVAAWAMEKGSKDKVIEKIYKDGKTYFKVNDYDKLRVLFGELLKEIQRIKSEGDFEAGKALVENYGVKVDQELHKEILERNSKFKSAPYSGFINPVLVPKMDENGEITDIIVEQPESFAVQMLAYAKDFTTLPDEN
ncbi:dipeptidyl-peptidase 3 family protein [Lutimonas zeaxanthinifaciens]|uniref:dipeptidyl-peptidase 3 family protein n=1 Tax=Lutimonas zeaxanthinifaciens TaxID=3060215 RepID=UPI00265CFF60|nr:dihydrofolate reductase [Lutimonas sp. YSD2104]WKK65476.1 dihydrofolate reductase [Lutimonas sp. YSD2104]